MHNVQDNMPIRKIGKPLIIFKARLSLVISIWLLFLGDLKIPFIRECCLIISYRKHCFYPFTFQVDEALHKLLADYCSRAGVIGFFGGGGRLRRINLLEDLEQRQQP